MAPDELQQAWQAQSSQTRVIIDVDLLRQEVQRDQINFRATVFYRDFVEIAISLLLIPAWFILGAQANSPWTFYLTVPVLIWMAGFMIVYRMRHKQPPAEPDEPLLQCVERSITEVEHQIWLLRNILWWYLLPPGLTISIFFAHVSWQTRSGGWLFAILFFLGLSGFLLVVYGSIYLMNQRAVRFKLEPRRQELLILRASLQDDSNGAGTHSQIALPQLPFTETGTSDSSRSPLRIFIGLFSLIVLFMLLFVLVTVMKQSFEYPKTSPFAAVRWQDATPEVKLDDRWYELIALNDIPADEIVTFSKAVYGDKWQKRFEEDLVELLSAMGHPPGNTVTLVVRDLETFKTEIRIDVPLTKANRAAIRNAAQQREHATP